MTRNVNDIIVGDRHRKDLGDVRGLADSIGVVGLLHPVVVDRDGKLIAGRRRLEAVKLLGWPDVPVTIAETVDDLLKALQAERDENIHRLDFVPTDAVAMAKAIEEEERRLAEERRVAQLKQNRVSSEIPRLPKLDTRADSPKNGVTPPAPNRPAREKAVRSMDQIAAAVGMGRSTLQKATAVVEAAKKNPTRYGDLPKRMDATKRVDPVHKELVRRQLSEGLPKHNPDIYAGVKWTKAILGLRGFMIGVRDEGGFNKLIRSWSAETKADAAKELRDLRVEMSRWITALEEHDNA